MSRRVLEPLGLLVGALTGLVLMTLGLLGGLPQSGTAMLVGGSLVVGAVGIGLIVGVVPLSAVSWRDARQRAATLLALSGVILFVIGTEAGSTFSPLAAVGIAAFAVGFALMVLWLPAVSGDDERCHGDGKFELTGRGSKWSHRRRESVSVAYRIRKVSTCFPGGDTPTSCRGSMCSPMAVVQSLRPRPRWRARLRVRRTHRCPG